MPHLPIRIFHTILPNSLIRSWGKLGSELLVNLTNSPLNLISIAPKWGKVVKHITPFRGKMKLPKYTKQRPLHFFLKCEGKIYDRICFLKSKNGLSFLFNLKKKLKLNFTKFPHFSTTFPFKSKNFFILEVFVGQMRNGKIEENVLYRKVFSIQKKYKSL